MSNEWPCITCSVREKGLCGALFGSPSLQSDLTARPRWQAFRQFRAGKTILQQWETTDRIYILCDGWAFRYFKLSDGRRQILNFLLSGDLFSSLTLFCERPYFSVDALTDIRVSSFERAAVMPRLASNAVILATARHICVDETIYTEQLLTSLGQAKAEERIAFLFLRLAKQLSRINVIRDHHYRFPLRLQHIADATGLTPVHVSRVINRFRKRNLINISGTSLTFLDPAELERLASLK